MDLKESLALLRSGLDLAQKAVPVAASLGLPNTNVAGAFVEIGRNLVDRVDAGAIAATSEDVGQLKAILADLQAANDSLAAEIDAS